MSTKSISRRDFVKQSAWITGISCAGFRNDLLSQASHTEVRSSIPEEKIREMPNILIFCPDEMVAYKTGTFGHPMVKTPNMDRLADNGVKFTNHYICYGKCVPSRVSLMTGAFPHAEGFRSNQNYLNSSRPNLMSNLKQLGYVTALVGKNHCFAEEELDAFLSHRIHPVWEEHPESSVENRRGLHHDSFYRGLEKDVAKDTAFTDSSIEFIKKRRGGPFFLWLNNDYPHPPYRVQEPFYSMYNRAEIDLPPKADYSRKPRFMRQIYETYQLNKLSDDDWRELIAVYYGMISHADYEFGRVLDALDETGQFENTIIVFWSDHGDFAGEFQLVEKWDTCMQDCIINTPLIISGPRVPKGNCISEFVQTTDIAATIYDFLDIDPHYGMQDSSLLGLMLGQSPENRDVVFCEGGQELAALLKYDKRQVNRNPNYVCKQTVLADEPRHNIRTRAVRTKTHKLVYRLWGINELYDLEKDRHELHNVYGDIEYQDVQNELMEQMLRWEIETETVIPEIEGLRA